MTDSKHQQGLPRRFIRLSRIASVGCWLLGPGLLLATFFSRMRLSREDLARAMGFRSLSYIAVWQEVASVVLALTPVLLVTLGMFQLGKAFAAVARGEYFEASTIRRLRRFAALMLGSALAGLVLPSVCSLVLSYGAPEGQGLFSVGVGSGQVFGLLCAGGTWLFSALLAEARRLQQENSEFV